MAIKRNKHYNANENAVDMHTTNVVKYGVGRILLSELK
jgi:hypothetical protein